MARERGWNRGVRPQAATEEAALASADLRLAAWFLWMTPLLAALSSLREAAARAVAAASASPAAIAVRTERTAVRSSDFVALLRRRRFSLVRLRLIWDLMLAT